MLQRPQVGVARQTSTTQTAARRTQSHQKYREDRSQQPPAPSATFRPKGQDVLGRMVRSVRLVHASVCLRLGRERHAQMRALLRWNSTVASLWERGGQNLRLARVRQRRRDVDHVEIGDMASVRLVLSAAWQAAVGAPRTPRITGHRRTCRAACELTGLAPEIELVDDADAPHVLARHVYQALQRSLRRRGPPSDASGSSTTCFTCWRMFRPRWATPRDNCSG